MSEWISFSDELPPGATAVLGLTKEGGYRICYWYDGNMHTVFEDDNCLLTHWMPLPSLPEG